MLCKAEQYKTKPSALPVPPTQMQGPKELGFLHKEMGTMCGGSHILVLGSRHGNGPGGMGPNFLQS